MLGVEDEGPEQWEDEVDEPWVADEKVSVGGKVGAGGVGKGVAEKKAEKEKEKEKDKGKGTTPKKGGRESGGRKNEGTFGRLRREREERRRER